MMTVMARATTWSLTTMVDKTYLLQKDVNLLRDGLGHTCNGDGGRGGPWLYLEQKEKG